MSCLQLQAVKGHGTLGESTSTAPLDRVRASCMIRWENLTQAPHQIHVEKSTLAHARIDMHTLILHSHHHMVATGAVAAEGVCILAGPFAYLCACAHIHTRVLAGKSLLMNLFFATAQESLPHLKAKRGPRACVRAIEKTTRGCAHARDRGLTVSHAQCTFMTSWYQLTRRYTRTSSNAAPPGPSLL